MRQGNRRNVFGKPRGDVRGWVAHHSRDRGTRWGSRTPRARGVHPMNEREIIDALVATWVDRVAPTVRPDCCILAARVAAGVLDYHGITNRVVPCRMFLANDAALD